jgi:hypothetical protein
METKSREQHLSDQMSSNQTVREYCAQHTLNLLTFYKWRSLARKSAKKVSAPQHSRSNRGLFREIHLSATQQTHSALEYRITGSETGFVLSIPQGFSPLEVQTLLSVMAKSDCAC